MPTRRRAGSPTVAAARASQILGGRDLHVRRFALDDVHAVAGALGQRRFVGRLDARRGPARSPRPGRRAGTPAASAPERSCRAESSRRSPAAGSAGATRLTVSLTGSAAIAAPCSSGRVDRARDQVRRHERPRRVVDQHDVGRRGRRDRTHWPPNPAAARRPRRHATAAGRARAASRRRRRRASAGSATMTSSTADEQVNAATLRSRIDRPPMSSSCFGSGAEPAARAAGGDDGGDMHG